MLLRLLQSNFCGGVVFYWSYKALPPIPSEIIGWTIFYHMICHYSQVYILISSNCRLIHVVAYDYLLIYII
jgi:hypothetical protein